MCAQASRYEVHTSVSPNLQESPAGTIDGYPLYVHKILKAAESKSSVAGWPK